MSAERNEHDLELLSAYIDGQLADLERAALETRLRNEPALRQQLAELRAAIGLIRDLPLMAAPRNFTLTPAMVRPQVRPRTTTTYLFSFVSAAAALLLFIAGFGLLSTSRQGSLQSGAPNTTLLEATLAQDIAAVPTGIAATPTDEPLVLEFAVSSSEEAASARAFSEPDSEAADTFLAPQGTPSDEQAGEPEMQLNAASEADTSPSPQIQSYSITQTSAEANAEASAEDTVQDAAAQEAAPEETGINSIAMVPPSAAEITALATDTTVVPEAFAGAVAQPTTIATVAALATQPPPTPSTVAQATQTAAPTATTTPSSTMAPSSTMTPSETMAPTETPVPLPTFIPITAEQPAAPPASEAPIGVLMIVGALVLLALAVYAFFSSRLR